MQFAVGVGGESKLAADWAHENWHCECFSEGHGAVPQGAVDAAEPLRDRPPDSRIRVRSGRVALARRTAKGTALLSRKDVLGSSQSGSRAPERRGDLPQVL